MLVGASYTNQWEYWQLYHKVTFDGPNKLIRINYPETSIDVTRDIYSSWKEWVLVDDNAKYLAALNAVGGNPLPIPGLFLDATFFLINGWRVITWDDGPHSVDIVGNLFTDVGDPPYISVPGATYNSTVSNIVRRIQDENEGLPQADLDAIADAVWSAMSADFGDAGTFGALLASILQAVDASAIAAAILDAALVDHTGPDTFGEQLQKKQLFLNLGDISKEVTP